MTTPNNTITIFLTLTYRGLMNLLDKETVPDGEIISASSYSRNGEIVGRALVQIKTDSYTALRLKLTYDHT